jgi:predicted acylesterase/phospholipase RssA
MTTNAKDPLDTAPEDRFCDLVMKGGITSGVVYPLAILELSKDYRFKNIGGTSAGAIAAAVTAAAEYRRRHGSMSGFDNLRSLPTELGESVGSKSRLLSLFEPSVSTARLFNALLSTLNRGSTGRRWLWGFIGFLKAYWASALLGLAGALLLLWVASFVVGPPAPLGAVLLAILFVIGGVGLGVYRDLVNGLIPNGFGLCKCGPDASGESKEPALVPWMHRLIQKTAGRSDSDPPLTFKDLWNAPGFPPAWLEIVGAKRGRSINLQLFTTNLTHGRPYHLPLEDETSRLFFKASELEAYFTRDVIDHLVKYSKPYQPVDFQSDPDPRAVDADLLELPCEDLPIVVAVRLSLSFPILISAVKLWAIDYEPKRGERTIRPCWFSDGGICSNFPIHLFDGFLPMWPTFGISLGERNEFHLNEATWLPELHKEGRGDSWVRFADNPSPIGQLGGFLASIVTAAQSWNDATATRLPGVRDRVVQVRLDKREGGLNLDMPGPLISKLAGYGQEAGAKLRSKFAPHAGSNTVSHGWSEHRWVRFNVVANGLRERLKGLNLSAALAVNAVPLGQQINSARTTSPLAGEDENPLTAKQADSLALLLQALLNAEKSFAVETEAQPYRPVPEPSIRVRSPL